MTLTEQFNNDEIDESKLYYFKQKMSEEIEIGHPFSLNMVRAMDGTYLDWFLIAEVLAPVPSYEKWQLMQDDNKRLKHDVGNLGYKIKNQRKEIERQIAQNAQLKELLKECKDIIEWYKADTGYVDLPTENILTRINAAIGESEE